MNQQKIVVILLLVTIILSIFSVVLTLSIDTSASQRTVVQKDIINNGAPSSGNIVFGVIPTSQRNP
jgi:hypothetical protein